jgi:hypothetical protein
VDPQLTPYLNTLTGRLPELSWAERARNPRVQPADCAVLPDIPSLERHQTGRQIFSDLVRDAEAALADAGT